MYEAMAWITYEATAWSFIKGGVEMNGDLSGCKDLATWREPVCAYSFPLSPIRFQYEEEVKRSPLNYDNWFDYVKLEESTGDVERIREVSRSKCK